MEKYYKKLPRKRLGAGALIFDQEGRILIVKLTYRDYWSMPGGTVDKDESPREACLREVKEEIGLKLKKADFICVDYIPKTATKHDSIQMVYNCGVLTEEQISRIRLQKSEISEYKFVLLKDARPILGKPLAVRLTACVRAVEEQHSLYLENGLKPELQHIHHKKHNFR